METLHELVKRLLEENPGWEPDMLTQFTDFDTLRELILELCNR